MIANISRRPFLQVGKYCITSYDDEWLAQAFDRAAVTMGGDVSPFRQDLMAGVIHYLEEVCTMRILPVEDLFSRIRSMLNNIGLASLAESLDITTPPVSVDLHEIAENCPIPLFFFQNLKQELEELKDSGVDSCAFSGMKECVMALERAKRWSSHCERTTEEILSLISAAWNASRLVS